jgi:hypothetical protein
MKTIISLLMLIVLASLEVTAGDSSPTSNPLQPGHPFLIITSATNDLANINTRRVITNGPAVNRPAIINWPATNLPAIPDPPTRLRVQAIG